MLGATALTVLQNYAGRLSELDGRLYLSGVDPRVAESFQRAGHLDEDGPLQLMTATSRLGASTEMAFDKAQAWIAGHDRGDSAGAKNREGAAR